MSKEELEEHYRYVYLSLLCERYEKAAKRSGTREGCVAAMYHSVAACEMGVESTKVSIDRFGLANDQLAEIARRAADAEKEKTPTMMSHRGTHTGDPSSAGGKDACEVEAGGADVDINLFDPSRRTNLNVEVGPSIEVTATFENALQTTFDAMGINPAVVTADELLDYFDKCLDCDLKMEFSWQLQPLNLMLGFEDFLRDIEEIIDEILAMLNPNDMLLDLCDFFDGFSFICIPDLIMLLLALAMLIKKYVMLAISFSFDWTMIIGPIIKWIVDAIAALIQQIMQIVIAPIDCAIGIFQSVQEVIDAADELQDTMMAAGQALAGQATLGMTDLGGIDASARPTPGITSTTAPNIAGKESGFSLARDVTGNMASGISKGTGGWLKIDKDSGGTASEKAAERTIPTGFTVGVNDTFQTFFDKRRQAKADGTNKIPAIGDIKTFKRAILALQDFKQMIVDFFSQILFVVKSLNALFGGKLALNVEAMGIIMLITDLIKLIQIIIALKKGGLENCDELRDNPEKVMDAISIVCPDRVLKLNGAGEGEGGEVTIGISDSSGLYQGELVLPECSSDLTQEDRDRIRARVAHVTSF
tara:strand:- start:43984 stop:45750 length:1767 start_codon:yes stop_codon:yes gene_type:complete